MFQHQPCNCDAVTCLKGVEPPTDCVNRLEGVVEPAMCAKCGGNTLHHNGECLPCKRGPKPEAGGKSPPTRVEMIEAPRVPGLTLTIKCGNEFVVSDKKQVQRILKILLEE